MNNLQTAGRARGHLLPRLGDEFRISVVEIRSGQGPIYCRFDDLDGHIFKPSRSAFFDGTDFHKSIPFVAFRPPESRKRSPFPFRTHSRSARNRAAFRPDFAHDRNQKSLRGLHAGRKRFFWEGARGRGSFSLKRTPPLSHRHRSPFVAFRPPESRKRSPLPSRTPARSTRNRVAIRPDFAHDRNQKYFRGLHAGRKRFFWEGARGRGSFSLKRTPPPQSPHRPPHSSGIPAALHALRVASSQRLHWTSPMWAQPIMSMQRRDWPMPPPMVRGSSLLRSI